MIKELYHSIFPEKIRIKIRLKINKLISFYYCGNIYSCNCCGRSFRHFLPKGTLTIRKNAKCPYCGSLERTRILLFYLKNETKIFTQKASLLHIAPEWCLIPHFRKNEKLNYIDGDINPALASHIVDLTNISYSDNSFDYIICSHVLGHIPNEAKAIQEMIRVLKSDGTAIVMTIIDWNRPQTYETSEASTPQKKIEHYTEQDLMRLHGSDFSSRLEAQGFKVKMIDYSKTLGAETSLKYCFGNGEREMIFICRK